jgi:acyl-CoA synthetase (AMP-forming)/AMP-acid ligase II
MPALIEMITQRQAARLDQLALISDGQTWTYRQLADAVARTRQQLAASGVLDGEVIGVLADGSATSLVLLLALDGIGLPLPFNAALRSAEIAQIMSGAGAGQVLLPRGLGADARRVAGVMNLRVLDYWLDEPSHGPCVEAGEARDWRERLRGRRAECGEALSLLLATSGSTGTPKLVAHARRGLIVAADATISAYGLTTQDIRLNFMPLYHIQGIAGAALPALLSGGQLICMAHFSARRLDAMMRKWQPTWFSASPLMHRGILAETAEPGWPSLRFVRVGSEGLDPGLRRRLETAYGVPIIGSYGMTEGTQLASTPMQLGESGLRPTGASIRVIGASGRQCVGTAGMIQVRGGGLAAGYLRDGVVRPLCDESGWFATGDLGIADPDGTVAVLGRIGGLISRGGEKFHGLEVENALLGYPAVADCQVRVTGSGAIEAVIVEASPTTDAELREFMLGVLAPFKVPACYTRVARLATVDGRKKSRTGLVGTVQDPEGDGRHE